MNNEIVEKFARSFLAFFFFQHSEFFAIFSSLRYTVENFYRVEYCFFLILNLNDGFFLEAYTE